MCVGVGIMPIMRSRNFFHAIESRFQTRWTLDFPQMIEGWADFFVKMEYIYSYIPSGLWWFISQLMIGFGDYIYRPNIVCEASWLSQKNNAMAHVIVEYMQKRRGNGSELQHVRECHLIAEAFCGAHTARGNDV